MTPLLIVVQVAQTDRSHIPSSDFSKTVLTAKEEITFRAGVSGERDSHQDLAFDFDTAAPSRSLGFVHSGHA